MDARLAQPLYVSTTDNRYESPVYEQYKFGPHNPSVNGGKLYECTRIKTLTEEREIIQKKTFTKWSNTFLKSSRHEIDDLFTDLCDGRTLLKLIEAVSGCKMPTPTPGRMRIHCLENVEKSLSFLDKLNVHLENIGAHDIVDGNNRIILGLIWTIILRFQVQSISVIEKVRRIGSIQPIGLRRNSTEALLLWCKAKTQGYPNVHVVNFTTSWRDGLAFCALIHKHSPESIDFASLSTDEPLRNLRLAFATADRCLGIAKLLDPEDLIVEEPDGRSIITYLVTYYHYFARAKANTVQARRIERVIDLLRKFINGVKDYEMCAGSLLEWVHLSIQRMNDRRFEQSLVGLQGQLVEFNDFRTKEKPPRFDEKGDIEVSLFVIRSEMFAASMRTYTPPQALQLSEINKAWEILEQAEHARGLAINDELMQLEMLEQLFAKFETKCAMRESWLQENQQIAEQVTSVASQHDLRVALKKHEALEADIYAYEDRVQLLRHISNEFQRCGFFRTDYASSRCARIMSLWSLLLETLKGRRIALHEKLDRISRDVAFDHLMAFARNLHAKISSVIIGETDEDHEYAKKTIEAYDMEVKVLCIQVDRLLQCHGCDQEIEGTWIEIADQLMRALEFKRHCLPLETDVSRLLTYTRDRIEFIMNLEVDPTPVSVTRLNRQIKMLKNDINSKQTDVDACHMIPAGSNWDLPVQQLTQLWDRLVLLMASFKDKAMFLGDYVLVSAEIDDAESWVNEQLQILQIEDHGSLEAAASRTAHLLDAVEAFALTIDGVKDKANALATESASLQSLPSGIEATSNVTEKVRCLRELQCNVEAILTEKSVNLTRNYYALLEAVKRKQADIIDGISVAKFLQNASEAGAWISEKSKFLQKLKPVDLRNIYEEGLSGEMQESLACILRRFEELEQQMTVTADQVTKINKAASNLIDATNAGQIQNAATVLPQVSSVRNNLNDAWNQLADTVEDRRIHFNINNAFIIAGQDCLFTISWIEDKLEILAQNNWVDIPTMADLRRLERLLNSLQSDARVIRARVEDIGERVLDIYPLADAPLDANRKWLFEQHENLCQKMAQLDQELEKCRTSLAQHGSHLKSAMSLDDFQQWLSYFKDFPCCFAASSDPKDVSRAMATQEQNLQELVAAEEQLEKLLKDYESLAASGRDAVKDMHVNPEQVVDDYGDTCDLVRSNIANLHQIAQVQSLFAEAKNIEFLISKQDAYLLKEDRPNSVEACEKQMRDHENFIASMLPVTGRLAALNRKGRMVAAIDPVNAGRIIAKLDSLKERLNKNLERAHLRELAIKEERRLQDLLSDAVDVSVSSRPVARGRRRPEDGSEIHDPDSTSPSVAPALAMDDASATSIYSGGIREAFCTMLPTPVKLVYFLTGACNKSSPKIEDWMSEKLDALKQVSIASKRDVVSAYNQVKALQEEIESSRQRAEGIIETGRNLIDSCPRFDAVVTTTIDSIVAHWEDLLKELRRGIANLEESRREYMMNEAAQQILRWAQGVLEKAKAEMEDPSLMTAGLTELQKRLETHQQDCQDFDNYANMANEIKEDADALSQRHPANAGASNAVVTEISRQLDAADAILGAREDLLCLHQTVASHLIDLTSELLWVKDKLVQLRQHYNDWQPRDQRFVGGQLLRVHQARRRLMNHVAEIENRGPRVKNLCRKVKETYLGETKAAGPRMASFRDVLAELEQSWFTVTHILEVRREELRLADAIHKFCFDAVSVEAWVSERELYLQCLHEPTNIEEANRALRRLNVLQETITHWSDEALKTSRRGFDLHKQLTTGVKINGDTVVAPSAARDAVSMAAKGIGEAFSRLQSSVTDGRFDLMEIISLHNVIEDIADLEEWIASRYRVANNNDVGDDLEHCHSLHDRFVQFSTNTLTEGSRRIREMVCRIDQLILRGHKHRSEMALGKDRINEAWADLLEMIETRKQLLTSALAMHHFLSDTQCLEELIVECRQHLPSEPTIEMVTGRFVPSRQGIASLQRTQKALQQRLGHINERCNSMSTTANALITKYAGDQEFQLRTRRDCVLEMRGALVAEAERRGRELNETQRLHRFFITARSLLAWMDEKKEEMSHPNELSRTIYAVERLISEHRHLYSELGIKLQQVEECLNIGRGILEFATPVSKIYIDLTGPRGELREVCVLLATERIVTEVMWRERWDRLVMLLDARYFLKDAAECDAWLVSREVHLVSSRRSIGDTLAETLALLGAHYAFQKACASAEERFAALKRLTKMEIRALEWTPEDEKMHQLEKREHIRLAVREFIPSSYATSASDRPKSPPKPPFSYVPTSLRASAEMAPSQEFPEPTPNRKPRQQIERQPVVSFHGTRTTLPPVKLVDASPPVQTNLKRNSALPKRTAHASLPMVLPPVQQQPRVTPVSPSKSPSCSSTTASEIYFPKLGRKSSKIQPVEQDAETVATLQEGDRTTSSTQQQSSFPSTSAKTSIRPPMDTSLEQEIAVTTTSESLPRVEGPLIRKQDLSAGGVKHSRGRAWTPMYVTLQEGKLSSYRDQRTRRERPEECVHRAGVIDLCGARAAPALDYTKRTFVFRVREFTGAEYLFQAVSDEVLLRWVSAINDSANALAQTERQQLPQRAFSLPAASRHSRTSSAASSHQSSGLHKSYGSLRRVFKRHRE